MLLKIQNFCCWTDKEFEFPDVGSVLITAPSGSGKTSIMKAILFALFGVGEKIIQYGKKSCSVELQLHDLHIFRSKGPGRLIVNHSEEDEAGQHIIRTYFDNDLFYLRQQGKKNFIAMSSNEKLEYLEHILFRHIPLHNIKTFLRQHTKECEQNVLQKKTTLETIRGVQEGLPDTPDECDFSEQELETTLSRLETLQTQLRDGRELARSLQTAQYELDKRVLALHTEEEKQRYYEREIHEHQTQLEELAFQPTELDKCERQLQLIAHMEMYEQYKKEYKEQLHIYETSVKNEREHNEQDIADIDDTIATSPFQTLKEGKRRMETCRQTIQSLEERDKWEREKASLVSPDTPLPSPEEVGEWKRQVEYWTRMIQDIDKTYTCPKCQCPLKMHRHTLMENAEYVERSECTRQLREYTERVQEAERLDREWRLYSERVEYLDTKIKTCSTSSTLEEEQERLTRLQQEYDTLHTLKVQKKHLETQLQTIVQKYDQMKEHLQRLRRKYKDHQRQCEGSSVRLEEKEDISTRLLVLQTSAKAYEVHTSKLQQCTTTLDKVCGTIDTHRHALEQQHTRIAELQPTHDIHELETEETQCRQRVDSLKELKAVHHTIQMKRKYVEEEESLEIQLKEAEKELTAAMLMKQKILEAEGVALTNLIYTINTTVQMYLDLFFEKEPIQVQLCSYRKVKEVKKPQITLEVNYKGHQVDVSCLSGGEYDRIVLSFALAFSDLVQSPLLLLDECVSSLDQETADVVYNGIKQHCQQKLVLLVAHQIVTGMFDSVVRLK